MCSNELSSLDLHQFIKDVSEREKQRKKRKVGSGWEKNVFPTVTREEEVILFKQNPSNVL